MSAPAGSTTPLATYNYTECQHLLALQLHSLGTTTQSVSAYWLYYSTGYIQLHRVSTPAGSTTPLATYNYTECQRLLALLLHSLRTTTQSVSVCWLYYSTCYIQQHRVSTPAGSTTPLTTLHRVSAPAGSTTPLATYNNIECQHLLALLLHSLHYTECQRLLALLFHLLHTTTQSVSTCWLYYSTNYIQLHRASAPAGSTTPLAT